jgi:predicted GH43/DUF377 family glycosyl hydrolase
MKRVLLPTLSLFVAACAHYKEFQLPTSTSPDYGSWLWTARSSPVLAPYGPGYFDSAGLRAPSVLWFERWWFNLYSAYDGQTWVTAISASNDGFSWSTARKAFSPRSWTWEGKSQAAFGSALVREGLIWDYFSAGDPPRIGLARSPEGRYWAKDDDPVFLPGSEGSWDERAVLEPCVVSSGNKLYMAYRGEDRNGHARIGLAISADGRHWSRLRRNPVLSAGPEGSFDAKGVSRPALFNAHGCWWILFTGFDSAGVRRIGLARSPDGIHWAKTALVISGSSDWDRGSVADPTAVVERDTVRVWFIGSPTAKLDPAFAGKIGYGELSWHPL